MGNGQWAISATSNQRPATSEGRSGTAAYDPGVQRRTRDLWAEQDRHPGDRHRLFRAIGQAVSPKAVLYPGSFVDIAPSFVFPSVTYVDIDRRAARFFSDHDGVLELIGSQAASPDEPDVTFVHQDYTADLDLPEQGFDLLVSLYAGLVSAHCTRHLCLGGTLLAGPSHGDVAMAALDPRYRLSGVVLSRSGDYRVTADDLDTYLIPKHPEHATRESVLTTGRGVAYTRPAFAYLFERID